MSFHVSCEDIRIEVMPGDATYLCCAGKDVDGNWHPNRLRLDDIIGNSDGWFIWGGRDFTHSAREIHLEHGANGPHLTAELPMRDGGYRERQGIDLADKIRNENGRLIFLGP
ncbi:hypothetical protein DTO271G3_3560 [Paecilomyces variotii]|nr:hypothetical protein DTO271G3_3560 [Paecilomyces variotii]